MMRGLPGSGKSTKAKEIAEASGNTVRLNRDLLRTMLHFDKFNYKLEDMTRKAEIALTKEFLSLGKNVIVDDTNFKNEEMWHQVAEQSKAKFDIVDVNPSIDECIEQDSHREGKAKVGRYVILNMAKENGLLENGRKDVIVDVDGTVADLSHRRHFLETTPKDYKSFFDSCINDSPRTEIIEKVKKLSEKFNIFIVSGRPDSHREETTTWLINNGVPFVSILMRRASDHRPDTDVKFEILRRYFNPNNVEKVFDDRPSVIRMWRENGLSVEDVGNGIEF